MNIKHINYKKYIFIGLAILLFIAIQVFAKDFFSINTLTTAIYNNPEIDSWNSICELNSEKDLNDINVVKAALNDEGQIIYFFRKSPSYSKFYNQKKYIKKVQGLIAYKKNALLEIANSSISII